MLQWIKSNFQWIKSNFQPFTIGQKVWLEARNLKTVYNKKIAPKREGPFQITNVLSPLTYSLQLPPTWRVKMMFMDRITQDHPWN